MHRAAAEASCKVLHFQSVRGSLEHRESLLFLYIIPLSTHLHINIMTIKSFIWATPEHFLLELYIGITGQIEKV